MDELEIKGKKYISSKRAAELTGYAKDYIGQLARGGKVPATRVGRAWYVEADALLGHKDEQPLEESSKEEVGLTQIEIRKPASPRKQSISPATLRALGYVPSPLPSTWSEVSYISDERDLIPKPFRSSTISENKAIVIEMPARKNPLENEVRIEILKGRIAQKPFEIQKPVAVSKKIKTRRLVSDTALSMGVLTAALGVFLFLSSGFFIGSNIAFSADSGSYTANVFMGFEYVQDFLSHYPPFQHGVETLSGFFYALQNSFADFFVQGTSFLKSAFEYFFKA